MSPPNSTPEPESKPPKSGGANSVLRSLKTAPLDDEPETDEEREQIEQARSDERAGRVVTTDELKRRLGL